LLFDYPELVLLGTVRPVFSSLHWFLGCSSFFGLVKWQPWPFSVFTLHLKLHSGVSWRGLSSTRRCTIFLTSRWPCTLPNVRGGIRLWRDQTAAAGTPRRL